MYFIQFLSLLSEGELVWNSLDHCQSRTFSELSRLSIHAPYAFSIFFSHYRKIYFDTYIPPLNSFHFILPLSLVKINSPDYWFPIVIVVTETSNSYWNLFLLNHPQNQHPDIKKKISLFSILSYRFTKVWYPVYQSLLLTTNGHCPKK